MLLGGDIVKGWVKSRAEMRDFEQRRRAEKVVARDARSWGMTRKTVYHTQSVLGGNEFNQMKSGFLQAHDTDCETLGILLKVGKQLQ